MLAGKILFIYTIVWFMVIFSIAVRLEYFAVSNESKPNLQSVYDCQL